MRVDFPRSRRPLGVHPPAILEAARAVSEEARVQRAQRPPRVIAGQPLKKRIGQPPRDPSLPPRKPGRKKPRGAAELAKHRREERARYARKVGRPVRRTAHRRAAP